MSVIIKHEHMADIDSNGKPVMYIQGTYETGDTLPTENIYQGSWLMDITTKDTVKFFNADTQTWG